MEPPDYIIDDICENLETSNDSDDIKPTIANPNLLLSSGMITSGTIKSNPLIGGKNLLTNKRTTIPLLLTSKDCSNDMESDNITIPLLYDLIENDYQMEMSNTELMIPDTDLIQVLDSPPPTPLQMT